MNRSEQILEALQAELGFASELVGGRNAVLVHIERFLARSGIPADDLTSEKHPQAWARLVAEVVVPETFFFRYPESFAALRDWLRDRPATPLRVLCVPCSTGEEAYSIAITLLEAGLKRFHVRAIDASAPAVARASTGRYPLRKIRGLPDEARTRWFETDAEDISVVAGLRSTISFETGNIFTMEVPGRYDVVFCRNLLIYFDPANQHRIFERLDRWLEPDGRLFLGPGEATIAAAHGWHSTRHPMSFSFQRGPTRQPPRSIAPPRKNIVRTPIRPPRPHPAPPPQKQPDPPGLEEIGALADAGRLAEAGEALLHFHANHEASAASLFLEGLLHTAQGRIADAEARFRKALYLDPEHLDALLHLSLLLEQDGRPGAAAPLRRRIERLTAP
jgi:chemotaxis protein methyltransferase WspC